MSHDKDPAHQGVEDDDLNMISLGRLVIEPGLAWELFETFLAGQYSGVESHRRRLPKVPKQESREVS